MAGQGWDTSAQSLSFSRFRSLSHLHLIPSSSLPSYSMLSCSLILPLPPADPAAHPPPPSPSFLSDILFRSLTLLSPRASRLTPPSRLKAPGCPRPSSPAPNPAPSAIDTPMRATPRQGRCASHNGRRCRDSRGEERGPTDSRVAAGERTTGSSPARRRKRERGSRRKSLRTEVRGRKRAETEKSRKREAERKRKKEEYREKKDRTGTREARRKERRRQRESERKGSSKTEGRRRYSARGRGKERPEQDSERRQRPFFDKLVTRRYPAAKGAEGSSPAQGGKRRGGRRSSWPKGEGREADRSEESGTGEEGWVRGGCRVLRRSITA